MSKAGVAQPLPDNNDCPKHAEYNMTCGTCNGYFNKDGSARAEPSPIPKEQPKDIDANSSEDKIEAILDVLLPRTGEVEGMTDEIREAAANKATQALTLLLRTEYRRAYRAGWEVGARGKAKKELKYTTVQKTICPVCKNVQEALTKSKSNKGVDMSKKAIEDGFNGFYDINELPFTKDQKEMVLEWFAQKIWNTLDEPGHCKGYDPLIIEGNTAHSYIFNLGGEKSRSGRHHSFPDLKELEKRLCREMQESAQYYVEELKEEIE